MDSECVLLQIMDELLAYEGICVSGRGHPLPPQPCVHGRCHDVIDLRAL